MNPTQTLFIEEGNDYFLDDNEELPYRLVRNLGYGHSANVEEVVDQWTGSVYARKVFRVNGSRTERRRIFSNEIKIIRRLARHHHIVRVFATYISRRETGLILSPVASQGDLETFMLDFRDGKCSESSMHILISAFGCLASGLLFMHDQHVRHKDIKPRNILIHQNSVIYTDFGYSLDHSTETGSTTTGRPQTLTRKYCAPEVQEWEPRNAKSDIYSLGCVFFEIWATLGFCNLPDTPIPYHERINEVQQLVTDSIGPVNHYYKPIASLTCRMLDALPEQRPAAKDMAMELWRHYRGHFCPSCRQSLPAGNVKDFPPQPLHEFYNTMRTNFTTGWMASDEMVSGGTLLDQMRLGQYAENNRNGAWTPVPVTGAMALLSPVSSSPKIPKDPIVAGTQPATIPSVPSSSVPQQSPVSLPLRRSATVIHNGPVSQKAADVKTPATTSPRSTRDLVAIPLVPIRTMTNPLEISPKTYAKALSGEGDRVRTPTIESNLRFPCLYAECPDIFTTQAKLQNHMIKHTKLFACPVEACQRHDRGFSSAEDLEQHMESVHRTGGMTWTHYQCTVEGCVNKGTIYPSYGKFKQHVSDTHAEMDQKALIKRSAVKPAKKQNRRRQMSQEAEGV